jgi:hypothetical protein
MPEIELLLKRFGKHGFNGGGSGADIALGGFTGAADLVCLAARPAQVQPKEQVQ